MRARLERHGDDLVLIIDPQMLDHLGIDENTLLEVSAQDRTLSITPVQHEADEFERAIDAVNKQYKHALKRLAQ